MSLFLDLEGGCLNATLVVLVVSSVVHLWTVSFCVVDLFQVSRASRHIIKVCSLHRLCWFQWNVTSLALHCAENIVYIFTVDAVVLLLSVFK